MKIDSFTTGLYDELEKIALSTGLVNRAIDGRMAKLTAAKDPMVKHNLSVKTVPQLAYINRRAKERTITGTPEQQQGLADRTYKDGMDTIKNNWDSPVYKAPKPKKLSIFKRVMSLI